MKNLQKSFESCLLLSALFSFLILINISTSQATIQKQQQGKLIHDLLFQSRLSLKLISKAKKCIPVIKDGHSLFCTGIIVKIADYKDMSLAGCKREIRKNGFKYITVDLQNRTYNFFKHSTKKALVLHTKKIVLLKPNIDRIDCIHELLHIEQRKQHTKNPLNPINRMKRGKKITNNLERFVARLALVEQNNKSRARQMSNNIVPLIKIQAEWEKLINWLDEKEIYYFIFNNCKLLNCQPKDKEIALANLLRLKHFLPWRTRKIIKKEINKLLLIKQRGYFFQLSKDVYKFRKLKIPLKFLSKENLLESVFSDPTCKKTNILYYPKKIFLNNFIRWRAKYCNILIDRKRLDQKFKIGLLSIEEYDFALLSQMISPLVFRPKKLSVKFRILKNKIRSKDHFLKTIIQKNTFSKIQFFLKNDQMIIPFLKTDFIFDTGAEDNLSFQLINILNKNYKEKIDKEKIYKENNYKDKNLIELKIINTPYGSLQMLKILLSENEKFKLGNGVISPFSIIVPLNSTNNDKKTDQKYPSLPNILSLNILKNTVFEIDFTKNIIAILKNQTKRSSKSLSLQKNAFGKYDAIEIICPNSDSKTIIRIDTGSQVYGDRYLIRQKQSNSTDCGVLKIDNHKLVDHNKYNAMFSKDVSINLGIPFLKQYKKIRVNLIEGWVEFL